MMPSIRVSLRYEEAEALLEPQFAEPRLRLQARSKLIRPLLADRTYVPPVTRRALAAEEVGCD